MAWRKFDNHKDETKAVRAALGAAGIDATVGHGRGTGWGWLEINVGSCEQFGSHERDSRTTCRRSCRHCLNYKALTETALKIAKEVTGRHGEYDGEIRVLAQDHWDRKRKCSVSILHPRWKVVEPASVVRLPLPQAIEGLLPERAVEVDLAVAPSASAAPAAPALAAPVLRLVRQPYVPG